ncbi:MAG: hypothetical protein Q9226_002598 [Calogaya cf. arnoldii]
MPSTAMDSVQPSTPWLQSPDPNPRSRFRQLINDIRFQLGSDNSLISSDNHRRLLQRRFETYKSEEPGWEEYAFPDFTQTFTRNLVDRGNGKYNLLVLVWTPGLQSPIHDHANSHCIMKILKGTLTETRYEWPQSLGEPMKTTSQTNLERDQVVYMADNLGLHKISNPDSVEYAVSLHLYTPPNAAIEGCNVFDPETGVSTHVDSYSYYSEFGIRSTYPKPRFHRPSSAMALDEA